MVVAHLVVRCQSWSAEGGGRTAWCGRIGVKEGDSFCLLPYTWRNVLEVTHCDTASVHLAIRTDAGRGFLPTYLHRPAPSATLTPLDTVALPVGVTLHLSTYQLDDGGLLWDITVERIAEEEGTDQQADDRSLAYGYYYGTTCFEVVQGLDMEAIDKRYLGGGWW